MILNHSILRHIRKADRSLWCKVTTLLHAVNDFLTKNPSESVKLHYRCHSLCDALAATIPELTVVDGYYLGLEPTRKDRSRFGIVQGQHSWLYTKNKAIIDPYPVGLISMNPIILPYAGKFKSYGRDSYFPNPQVRKDITADWLTEETTRWVNIMKKVHSPK